MSDPRSSNSVIEYENPRAGQPLDSRIVFEEHADGVSYTILPEGLRGAAISLTLFGIPLALLLALALLVLWNAVAGDPDLFIAVLIILLISSPLAALWALIYRAARRPTVLSVRGGVIALFSGAALPGRVTTWRADEVAAVEVTVTGVNARLRSSADLKMRLHGRRLRTPIIAGHDCADLEWMAHGLRGVLHLQ